MINTIRERYCKFLLCCLWVMSFVVTQAQLTFSKTYHLEVGNDNRSRFFVIEDTSFLVGTTHSGDMEVLSALTRCDFDGNILIQNSYSDFVINGSRSVVVTKYGFDLAGHRWSLDKNFARDLELVKVSKDLEFTARIPFYVENERNTNFPGILDINENLKAVYGSFVDLGSGLDGGAYIAVLDKVTDSIYSEVVFRGPTGEPYSNFDLYELQSTPDGNLLFIAEADPPGSGPGTGSKMQLVKLKFDGEIITRIISENFQDNRVLAQDQDGDMYISRESGPFTIDSLFDVTLSSASIMKFNVEMDSVLWSFELRDFDEQIESRGYRIFGIRALEDGNMLAVGRAMGVVGDCEVDIDCSERMGMLCKFTKDGEVLWIKEYGVPIPEEFLGLASTGRLGAGFIRDCQELEDGRLLCMGENAYAIPGTSFYRELWILMLDADGCLEPGCAATQILTSTHQVETYDEGVIYPNPVSDILHVSDVSFDTYKIFDFMGRVVSEGMYTDQILVSDLHSGMYVLQLKESGRLKSVFKFVKE